MSIPHSRLFEVSPRVYPFQDRWLDVDGVTLHYIDEGRGPAIVFFHGNPTWSLLYRNIIPALSENFRCVCIDYPGYGLSERPPKERYDYMPRTHADIVEKAFSRLKLDEFSTFHHDWGGPIGLAVAGRRPERIRKIIIGNSWAFPVHREARFAPLCDFSVRWGTRENKERVIRDNMLPKAATALLRRAADREDPAIGDALAAGHDAPWRKLQWRYPAWLALNQIARGVEFLEEVRAGLARLREKPVLFLWGERDPVCPPALYREFDALLPNNRLVSLPEASHFIQEDSPARIVRELRAFLAE